MDTGRKKLNILVAIDEVPAPLWERLTPLAKVCFAREGLEAYHVLTSDGFDVMFLDLNLTGMDSLELLRRVRAEKLCPMIILTSAAPSFSYAQQGILYGVAAYLLRPLDVGEVEGVIRKLQSTVGTHDPDLREAARNAAGYLRGEDAPDTFLRLGEELTKTRDTAVEQVIGWRDYYEMLVELTFQRYPWLKLYHHPGQFLSLTMSGSRTDRWWSTSACGKSVV